MNGSLKRDWNPLLNSFFFKGDCFVVLGMVIYLFSYDTKKHENKYRRARFFLQFHNW